MAAHHRKRHTERARRAIRDTKLVKRLQDHALGLVEMQPTEVRAAMYLVDKKLPSLASLDGNGNAVGDRQVTVIFGTPDQGNIIEHEPEALPHGD
jgi:hypothetical protein